MPLPPCAERSVERGEPVLATASRVRRWLLVEQPGAWGHDALVESRLDPALGRSLRARARTHGVRVVLIRRPDRREVSPTRTVILAHAGRDARWIERRRLVDDAELADLDLGVLRSSSPPVPPTPAAASTSSADRRPVVLVCTHGRHDQCCANLGRPVIRALIAEGVSDDVDLWECSHIGGDRFAANVVALPSGVYLGRVPAVGAAAMIRDLAGDLVDLDHYRGRCCHPTLVQAADAVARRAVGERHVDGLAIDDVDLDVDGDGDTAEVRFAHRAGAVRVVVRRVPTEPVQLSCGAGSGTPWRYEAVGVAID